jgi:NADPH:quinone reductase-like Zn-dependent oxidoreductase
MKAARIHQFGGPERVRIDEIDRPRPKQRQILLKVGASSLNHIDLSVRAGELRFLNRFQMPMTLGFDVAGEIVECGAGVTAFLPGERVAAMTGLAAGGAAEYCCVSQDQAARLPEGISWADAAALPLAGATALQALRGLAHLRMGQSVLINGAAGGVGGFAVQLAKLYGAGVTAVCGEQHFAHVRSLGTDVVWDYQNVPLVDHGQKFDVIFDAAAKLDMEQVKALVHHGGSVVTTRPEPRQILQSIAERFRGSFKMHFMLTKPRANDFALLLRLVADGRLKTCVAKTFPLAETAEAHHFFEATSVAGKVVLLP